MRAGLVASPLRSVRERGATAATRGHALVLPKQHARDLLLHVVPRYADTARDGVALPWVPTPGDPTSLADVAAVLSAAAPLK